MEERDGVFWRGNRSTRSEAARPQGLVLSFYGHEKPSKRRREAASGSAVGSRGQKCLGKVKEEGTKKMVSATTIS